MTPVGDTQAALPMSAESSTFDSILPMFTQLRNIVRAAEMPSAVHGHYSSHSAAPSDYTIHSHIAIYSSLWKYALMIVFPDQNHCQVYVPSSLRDSLTLYPCTGYRGNGCRFWWPPVGNWCFQHCACSSFRPCTYLSLSIY